MNKLYQHHPEFYESGVPEAIRKIPCECKMNHGSAERFSGFP
jgi:hypothetical protein